ncbi:MAG: hypothetical protein SFY66_13850 [Oculatellaceae cyanobacterium bins.114]|nr:hypothetical protein [Oculatellaceae cyanobacterium bins.114]
MIVQPQNQMMRSPLDNLTITPAELDQIAALSFRDELAIALYQAIAYKSLKSLFSVLMTECLLMSASLILVVPINLIVLHRFQAIPPTLIQGAVYVGAAILVTIVWGNVMLWKRGQHLKILIQLLAQVQQFNRLVHGVQWLDQWQPPAELSGDRASHREEAITALWLTRDNLIQALNAEQIYRVPSHWMAHSDPTTLLENSLTTLMKLGLHSSVDEYSHLFNEILQINVILHREMAKLSPF